MWLFYFYFKKWINIISYFYIYKKSVIKSKIIKIVIKNIFLLFYFIVLCWVDDIFYFCHCFFRCTYSYMYITICLLYKNIKYFHKNDNFFFYYFLVRAWLSLDAFALVPPWLLLLLQKQHVQVGMTQLFMNNNNYMK